MTRIAFVNMGAYKSLGGERIRFSEPAHLLGMHGIAAANNHQSAIFQVGNPSPQKAIKEVVEYQPNVLALSFIGNECGARTLAHDLLKAFPGKRPVLLIGGTDVKYNMDQYIMGFSPYYPFIPGPANAFIIVKGEGEAPVSLLAGHGFNIFDQQVSAELTSANALAFYGPNTFLIKSFARVPLDQQNFLRPYKDLSIYDDIAQVRASIGCWASCYFCGNEPVTLDYRSPGLVLEEINHVRQLGAKYVAIASPNFVADPEKASAIMAVLPPGLVTNFPARVDSLYFAVKRHPDVWKRFGTWPGRIELGGESSVAKRLGPDWLGKYTTLDQAKLHCDRLDYILDFFDGSSTTILLYEMPFDWKIDLEILSEEVGSMIHYSLKYGKNVLIPADNIGNILRYVEGSCFSKTMNEWDYYNFEQDPRALFLALLIKQKIDDLAQFSDQYQGNEFAIEQASTFTLLIFLKEAISMMLHIPKTSFAMRPVMDAIMADGRLAAGLDVFFEQLKFFDGGKTRGQLLALFDYIYKKIVPTLGSLKKT